jgi:hypothetical protein
MPLIPGATLIGMLYEGVPLAETLTEAWLTPLATHRRTAIGQGNLWDNIFISFKTSQAVD